MGRKEGTIRHRVPLSACLWKFSVHKKQRERRQIHPVRELACMLRINDHKSATWYERKRKIFSDNSVIRQAKTHDVSFRLATERKDDESQEHKQHAGRIWASATCGYSADLSAGSQRTLSLSSAHIKMGPPRQLVAATAARQHTNRSEDRSTTNHTTLKHTHNSQGTKAMWKKM